MGWLVAFFLIALAFRFFLLPMRQNRDRHQFTYYSRISLLTKGEQAFAVQLSEALPDHLMACPKVRLADLISCAPEDRKKGAFNRIQAKHVDFVLVDKASSAIKLVIELDDKSHRNPRRIARDQFVDQSLCSAEIPLLRVKAASSYDLISIRQLLESRLTGLKTARTSF